MQELALLTMCSIWSWMYHGIQNLMSLGFSILFRVLMQPRYHIQALYRPLIMHTQSQACSSILHGFNAILNMCFNHKLLIILITNILYTWNQITKMHQVFFHKPKLPTCSWNIRLLPTIVFSVTQIYHLTDGPKKKPSKSTMHFIPTDSR